MSTTSESFVDVGLRLAVLGELQNLGVLEKADVQAIIRAGVAAALEHFPSNLLAEWNGRPCIDESVARQSEVLSVVLENLGELPLSEAQLGAITSLNFDAANSIYGDFEWFASQVIGLDDVTVIDTGGESNLYELRDLQGIDLLFNLVVIDLDGYGMPAYRGPVDLAPLAAVPSLLEVRNASEKYTTNIDVISHLIW